MTTTCDHTHTHITTEPQHITLTGSRTDVDVQMAVIAECRNGHQHTLYLVDIGDIATAATAIGQWASEHGNNCPGPAA